MLVVLPFCAKDEALVLKNLEWCRRLDASVPFKVLVVHDDLIDGSEVLNACRGYFSEVTEFRYPHRGGNPAWPIPQNFQFQQTAGYIYVKKLTDPWFWWEADATPLRTGWLNLIADAHEKGGEPFSGHIVGEPCGHMTGVGVYPWNVPEISGAVMATVGVPWDVAGKREMIPHVNKINDIIQHIWERNGAPFSFENRDDAVATLLPTAAIFHRCKDGSLIDALSGGVSPKAETAPKTETAVMTLGRYGDIMVSLPIAYHLWKTTGVKPAFITGDECHSILDGVNYVEKVRYIGHYSDLTGAISTLKPRFKKLLVAQMYGNHGAKRVTDSFCKDAWAQAGMLPIHGKVPLVFDNRDSQREAELVKQHIKPGLNLLLNLSGHSSPFPEAAALTADIYRRWEKVFNIVDLSKIKAARIYDLLGLYDAAQVLVTSDTATLHLAGASKIPAIELIADTPELWYGSRRAGNCVKAVRYQESSLRREEIHESIFAQVKIGGTQFIHVYPDFMGRGESLRRNQLAAESWKPAYATGCIRPMPVHDNQLYRMWEKDVNGKKLPFLKDVADFAVAHCKKGQWVLLTNTDTCFSPTIVTQLTSGLKDAPIGYARRRDFQRLDRCLTDDQIPTGHSYVGKDLFVFKPEWWETHRNEMPDMIFGAEGWDALLAILFEESGAKCWTNLIYHERHASYWEQPSNRYSTASQVHCLKLAKEFCVKHGKNPEEYGFR